ncbi:hypothetical protein O0L34_g12237 [Tuta absoluta]|nr:hypothetical protein O0L34_g12237 [Tuta absoluta]
MKIPQKNKLKKQNVSKKTVMKPKKEQVHIVAHEIKFARLLSGNEKKTRDRALKTLKKWLMNCFEKGYEFKEDDFMRIWKGLFYAVWMSDKPLIQEELCDNIAGILDLFPPEQYRYALLMVKVGFRAMATEWYGIDQHRMDKCLMLVRRYLRGSLRCVARNEWSEKACKLYAKMLGENDGLISLKTPMYARNSISMILHVIDCYLEEIAKVSKGDIPPKSLVELLRPFCTYMCSGEAPAVCTACRRLLTALLRQSAPGLQYADRATAWHQMGCPRGGPDALQEVSDDDEDDPTSDADFSDDDDKPLDPRAGRVDVSLRPLPVPAEDIAAMLTTLKAAASGKAYKRLTITINRFKQLAQNDYPLKVEEMDLDPGPQVPPPEQVAKSLISLEKQLMTTSDELALRGLSRKHRKRLLAKSRAGQSIVEEAARLARTNTRQHSAAGDWQVEETSPEKKKTKKQKQNSADKENINKKQKKRKLETNGDVINKKPKIEKQNDNKKLKEKKNLPKIIDSQKSKIKPSDTVIKDTPKKIKSTKIDKKPEQKSPETKSAIKKQKSSPTVVSKKVKNFQKQLSPRENSSIHSTPKKVKFVLKNNSMQETVDYYKSVRQSPNIPFDSKKTPSKTNLKPSTPSPINPFFKKKWNLKKV